MGTGWNFPSNNNGEINGIGEAGIETFKGSLFASLAREICQNSLDARMNMNKPVKVEFQLSSIKGTSILGFNDLFEAIKLCREYWLENPKTVNFFDKAIKICKKENIDVLRISDFNTTGLTGSNEIKSSPWQDLVKSSGVSNKSGESGGSFGIGKSAPFACSDLRTVFYNTLDKDGLKAHQGVAKLVSFEKQRGIIGKDIKQGKGYYGDTSCNTAIKKTILLDGYNRTEIGTDVYVLGFIDNLDWKDEVIKAILNGYLINVSSIDKSKKKAQQSVKMVVTTKPKQKEGQFSWRIS